MCLPKNGRKLVKGTFITKSQFSNFPYTIETGRQQFLCSLPEQLFLKYTFKKQMLYVKCISNQSNIMYDLLITLCHDFSYQTYL
jgi:hypothetical protein